MGAGIPPPAGQRLVSARLMKGHRLTPAATKEKGSDRKDRGESPRLHRKQLPQWNPMSSLLAWGGCRLALRPAQARAHGAKRGRVSLVQWQGGAGRAGLLSARPAPTPPMNQDGAPPFCPMRLACACRRAKRDLRWSSPPPLSQSCKTIRPGESRRREKDRTDTDVARHRRKAGRRTAAPYGKCARA